MPTPIDVLGRAPYVLLTTFRRDGTPVPTPVWVVRDGPELLVWTNPEAGKVKRIRRDGSVQIGPCTRSGKPLGRPVAGNARIMAADELDAVMTGLVAKYGLLARLTALPDTIGTMLGRPRRPTGGVAITIETQGATVGS